MSTIRFVRSPNEYATCASCKNKEKPRIADWFMYLEQDQNAIALCNRHAVYQLGSIWAMGYQAIVDGKPAEMPAGFAEIEARVVLATEAEGGG